MTHGDWKRELTLTVGRAVDARRKELGLTAQQISDRTTELGHTVGRSTVNDLHKVDRPLRLTVPDWLVLAAALDMPPAALLFPELPEGTVAPLPNVQCTSAAAVRSLTHGASSPYPFDQSRATQWQIFMDQVAKWEELERKIRELDELARASTGATQEQIDKVIPQLPGLREKRAEATAYGRALAAGLGVDWVTVTTDSGTMEAMQRRQARLLQQDGEGNA